MKREIVRQRVPWFGLVGILLIVAMTLGNAAANMLPMRVPSAAERQDAAQAVTATARKLRLQVLITAGDRCNPVLASERARLLVFDGQSARAYADDFARRCGASEHVMRWRDIMAPPSRRLTTSPT